MYFVTELPSVIFTSVLYSIDILHKMSRSTYSATFFFKKHIIYLTYSKYFKLMLTIMFRHISIFLNFLNRQSFPKTKTERKSHVQRWQQKSSAQPKCVVPAEHGVVRQQQPVRADVRGRDGGREHDQRHRGGRGDRLCVQNHHYL